MKAKKTHKIHTQEFKQEAVNLAAKQGVGKTAKELGIYESQIYDWRAKLAKKASTSEREAELAAEVVMLKRQLAEQAEDLAILKRRYLLREKPKIKRFEFMLEHQHCFSVKRMAMVLQVSRSGYYDWCKNGSKLSNRTLNQQFRDMKIRELFDESKGRYGATRIQKDLIEDGSPAAIKTISDSMRRQKLIPKAAKKFKVTTDSNHQLPIADNLLERDFSADAPNQKWVQDITYLWTSEGWLYLAVVIDLYSRAVVGWSMNERMNASLVTDSLTMAMFRRGMPKGVIIHSDRGSQYCSYAYRDLAREHDFKISMSRKGNCWDNAVAESFFHSLKVEAIQFEPVMTRTEMRQAVFEYIDVDYNRKRRHSSIGYTSPFNFELKNIA